MKEYVSSSLKWLLLCLIVFVMVLIAAVVILVFKLVSTPVSVPLMIFAVVLFILFLIVFLAERSRYLIVDNHQINLPRGAVINGKSAFSRTLIEFDSVCSFESKFRKGDHGVFALIISLLGGVYAKDTTFYSIKLTNGDTVTFTLYEFCKESEKEIVSTIYHRAILKDDCI
jgi:hypothetical protein